MKSTTRDIKRTVDARNKRLRASPPHRSIAARAAASVPLALGEDAKIDLILTVAACLPSHELRELIAQITRHIDEYSWADGEEEVAGRDLLRMQAARDGVERLLAARKTK